jgi:hypothetical protein
MRVLGMPTLFQANNKLHRAGDVDRGGTGGVVLVHDVDGRGVGSGVGAIGQGCEDDAVSQKEARRQNTTTPQDRGSRSTAHCNRENSGKFTKNLTC